MAEKATDKLPDRYKIAFLRDTTKLEWDRLYKAGDEKIVTRDELAHWQVRDAVEILDTVAGDTELTNDIEKAEAEKARSDELKAKIAADKAAAAKIKAKAEADAKAEAKAQADAAKAAEADADDDDDEPTRSTPAAHRRR